MPAQIQIGVTQPVNGNNFQHIPTDEANFIFDYTQEASSGKEFTTQLRRKESVNFFDDNAQNLANFVSAGGSNQLESSFATFFNPPLGGNTSANKKPVKAAANPQTTTKPEVTKDSNSNITKSEVTKESPKSVTNALHFITSQ